MKIYIIDDEELSIYLTKHVLIEEGFSDDITSFLSAEEALTVLKEEMPGGAPQIILLDLNMPGMNGWDFLDELTSYQEQLRGQCRIYILTSSLDLTDINKSEEYELVSGFIHKVMDAADVQEMMTHFKNETNKNR